MTAQDNQGVRGSVRPIMGALLKRAGPPLNEPEPLPSLPPVARLNLLEEEAAVKAEGIVKAAAEAAERIEAAKAEAEKTRKQFEHNQRRASVLNLVSQARDHDGRKLFSPHDASVIWQMEALIHSVAGGSMTPLDPIFNEEPDKRRPIIASIDRAIRGERPNPLILDPLTVLEDKEREAVMAILTAKGLEPSPENVFAALDSLGPTDLTKRRLDTSDVQPPSDS